MAYVLALFKLGLMMRYAGVCAKPASMNCSSLALLRKISLFVPSQALEIPYTLQKLAISNEFDALVAIGAVIRGETYHFEVVSNESASGVMRVSLDHNIPIANAILTTNTDEQALERVDVKGREAAQVAVEMANLADSLDRLSVPENNDE
jgi:6,7-dimethyl-8-ribityllumazine synthase